MIKLYLYYKIININIMEFKRICPNCGKELMYKSETSYKNAIKKKSNSLCRSCASKER